MMKLKENIHKITIILVLLIVWGYLLLPIANEINLRPEFGEILAMGPSRAKIVQYIQIILIGIFVSLAAFFILKVWNYYFAKRHFVKEKKLINGKVKRYKKIHNCLSSFENNVAEPYYDNLGILK